MLKKLRCFLFAAEYESFSKAGKALFISQSAVSQQVISLEKTLGVTLLDRTEKSVTLTPAGKVLATRCRPLLQELEGLLTDVRSTEEENVPSLHLLYRGTAEDALIVPLLSELKKRLPQVVVEIEKFSGTKNRMAALRSGTVDALLGKKTAFVSQDELGFIPLCKTRLLAVVPVDHPFANASALTYQSLLDQPVVLLKSMDAQMSFREPSGNLRHQQTHNNLARDHQQPRLITYVPDTQSALTLSKTGFGITLIDSAWIADSEGVRIIPFEIADEDELGIFYALNNSNEALATLIEIAKVSFSPLQTLGPHGRLT